MTPGALRSTLGMLACGVAVGACSTSSESISPVCRGEIDPPADASSPRLEQTWAIATHNAYWVNHGVADPFASGVQERFADQIAVEGSRCLELDVHRDDDRPKLFRVYHTEPGNGLCDGLDDCLAQIGAVDAALPDRYPLTLIIELKEVTGANFDASHTPADLDAAFARAFGDRLLRPGDLFAQCDAAGLCPGTLGDCVAALGFPAVETLRGKVLVAILGTWDAIGAQATRDWVDFTLDGDMRDHASFSIASSWKLDLDSLPVTVQRDLTQDELDRAFAESGLMQIEDTKDKRLAPFLARRGYVRIDGADGVAAQQTRLDLGAQLLQTDTPWIRLDGADITRPVHGIGDAVVAPEPGSRLALDAASDGARIFSYEKVSGQGSARWEAMVAAGASGQSGGCLRAAAATGSDAETSFQVCRTKTAADRSAGAPGSLDAEQAEIVVTSCEAGTCKDERRSSRQDKAIGDFVAMEVTPKGAGACVQAFSAASADATKALAWVSVGERVCFSKALPLRGLSRVEVTDEAPVRVWFFGASRDGKLVAKKDFEATVAEPTTGPVVKSPASLTEASTR